MKDINKAVVANIKKDGHNFEILVDCDKALEFKNGKGVVDDCLAAFEIFKDAKKGDKASKNILEEIFQTNDFRKIAEIIIKQGHVQLTKEHLNKGFDELRKQIVNIIHRNAVDANGLPHPVIRIENAMDEAKIKIANHKTAEQQVDEIVEKLKPIIPIKFQMLKLSIKLPAKFSHTGFSVMKKYGKLLRNDWQPDGSLLAMIEMPAGIQDEFYADINKVCHGNVESKIIKD